MKKPNLFSKNVVPVLILMSLISVGAQAAPLSNEALYFRCYSQLTGDRPPEDSVMNAVRANTKNAIDACIEILDGAAMQSNGQINPLATNASKKAFDRLHTIHHSFFSQRDITGSTEGTTKDLIASIIDATTPAAWVTRALFNPSYKASSILTGNERLRLIRTVSNPIDAPRMNTTVGVDARPAFLFSDYPENNFVWADVGQVIGVNSNAVMDWKYPYLSLRNYTYTDPVTKVNTKPYPKNIVEGLYNNPVGGAAKSCKDCHGDYTTTSIRNRTDVGVGNSLGPTMYCTAACKTAHTPYTTAWQSLARADREAIAALLDDPVAANRYYKVGENAGGGYLGSHAYLMSTVTDDPALKTDLFKVPRRYSNAVFKDTICRTLPVIRQSDAAPFVQSSSPFSFRQSSSCTLCHASMDRMGIVIRNFKYDQLVRIASGMPYHYTWITPSLPAETTNWPWTIDNNFQNRPPNGNLYFRSAVDGSLVDIPVNGLEQLGQKISQTDDFYVCLANRYWNALTNKGVKMEDKITMDAYPLADRTRYSKIKAWGLELKADPNQRLMDMLKKMLRSSEYADSEFGP